MLKFLRAHKTQKRIYLFLAIVIIPAFLIWGVMIESDNTSPSTLGVLDGKKISLKDYLRSYEAVRHQIILFYGQQAQSFFTSAQLKGEAWDRYLLLRHAKKEKIRVSDQEVVRWIEEQPVFRARGQFSPELYQRFVKFFLHSNARDFEEEIRGLLTIRKIGDGFRAQVTPSEDELRTAFNEEFSGKNILYGSVSWESLRDGIEIPEQEVQQILPNLGDKLTKPEEVKIRYLSVPKTEAEARRAALDDKTGTLAEIASSQSLPVLETGFFTRETPDPALASAPNAHAESFLMEPGQESGWIEDAQGFYKISVVQKNAESPLSAEEIRAEIRRVLVRQRASEKALTKLKELKAALTDGNLEKALQDAGLQARRIDGVGPDRPGDLPGLGQRAALDPLLKGLSAGSVTEPFMTDAGAAILKVESVTAPEEARFQKDKASYRETFVDRQVGEKMRALVEGLRNRLRIDLDSMKKLFPEPEDTEPARSAR